MHPNGLRTRHHRLLRPGETVRNRRIKLTDEQIQARERFDRTLLEAHLWVKGRTTWYETVNDMKKNLDAHLETYNTRRPPSRPRPEGPAALRGVQSRDPWEARPQTLNRK